MSASTRIHPQDDQKVILSKISVNKTNQKKTQLELYAKSPNILSSKTESS